MREWEGDGIIARIENQRTADLLLRRGCPVVDVLGQFRLRGVTSFDTDSAIIAELAAEFFLRAGFRHFAYCGYRGIPFSDRRGEAFRGYLENAGYAVCQPPSLAPAPGRAENIQGTERTGLMGEAAVAAWLERQRRPLAVFACNDTCAQQVLNACRERGVRVPEEVAVLGVDNDDVLCNLCDPPLSSIDPNADELGYQAAALLDRLMRGFRPESDRCAIRPARLVERASTETVAIDDPITAKAVRFIRDHVGEGIAPKDVVHYAGRSRSDLEQRFRRRLKHGLHGEILRRRLDRVSVLLRRSDLDLSAVARHAGCSSATHLCRLFRRQFGLTPTEFRLAQSKHST